MADYIGNQLARHVSSCTADTEPPTGAEELHDSTTTHERTTTDLLETLGSFLYNA